MCESAINCDPLVDADVTLSFLLGGGSFLPRRTWCVGAKCSNPGRESTRTMLRSLAIQFVALMFPWLVRRCVLRRALGFEIAQDARIGLSLILAKSVHLGSKARIGNFNYIGRLDRISLSEFAGIDRFNWIWATAANDATYSDGTTSRRTTLDLGPHARITALHILDCTDSIRVGAYSVVAGYNSQILTHSVDIATGMQRASSVEIGAFCFVGTRVIILAGANIPSFSIIGAGAVVNRSLTSEFSLYAGVPAVFVKSVNPDNRFYDQAFRDSVDGGT